MLFKATDIPDVVLILPTVETDPRGFFMESWQEGKFATAEPDLRFVLGITTVALRNIYSASLALPSGECAMKTGTRRPC
jgi:dTDP-4-dehydrorhamnose 3,5-epimerase and related enzymes